MLTVIMVPTSCTVFTSCSSDDDDATIDIANAIGNWKCTASHDSWNGGYVDDYMLDEYLQINNDGTYVSTSSSMGKGTYIISGNKMIAESDYGRTYTATVSLKDDTLIINGRTNDGYKFKYTFKRVTEI